MGWWRPYFFIDPTGVQILLPFLELGSAVSYLLGALAIAAVCGVDRLLARLAADSAKAAMGHRDDTQTAALWTVQRATGGFVMLLLMTFNVPVFAWTIACLGATERAVLYYERRGTQPLGWMHARI